MIVFIAGMVVGYAVHTLIRLVREACEEHAHEVQKYQSLARACKEAKALR